MARTSARHLAAKRPSTALTAFGSFSALVAVSVALSNGSAPAPWQSARADDSSQGPARGTFGQPVDGSDAEAASLFAAVPDRALIERVREAPDTDVAGQVRTMSNQGTGSASSSVAPAKRAPATFQGELPVNTIIAPAQPTVIMDGGRFGWRTAPDTNQREFHNGTDVSAPGGSPVVAAMDGTVTAVFWDEWGGNRVEVSHANGMKTTYNHLEDVMVQAGDPLRASEQLGTVGQTGLRVTGPHLHFETWVQGKVVDAESFDWETGQGVVPASRPKYSLADQAQTPAAPGSGSVAGTDNGPVPEAPEAGQGSIRARSEEPAKPADTPDRGRVSAAEAPAPASKPDAAPSPQRPAARNTTKAPQDGAPATRDAAEQDAAPKTAERAAPAEREAASEPEKTPADEGGQDAAGRTPDEAPQGATERKAADETAAKKSEREAADKAAAEKAAAEKAAREAVQREAEERAAREAAEKAAAERKAAEKEAAEKAAREAAERKAAEDARPKPAKPAPVKPDDPERPKAPEPDPRTAPITQLTTLEQVQQRTKALLDEQLKLPVVQQFGPGSQLRAQLPLLSQQLITAKVAAQDPEFTAQLTAAQTAVDKAAAAPADQALAAAATAELTKLQTMLAEVPAK